MQNRTKHPTVQRIRIKIDTCSTVQVWWIIKIISRSLVARSGWSKLTSLEWSLAGSSVCSPDELNVQWKDSAGGDASTSHLSCSVSCLSAPSSSSRSVPQTGASANEDEEHKPTINTAQIQRSLGKQQGGGVRRKTSRTNLFSPYTWFPRAFPWIGRG